MYTLILSSILTNSAKMIEFAHTHKENISLVCEIIGAFSALPLLVGL
jgi:hypothetical protein